MVPRSWAPSKISPSSLGDIFVCKVGGLCAKLVCKKTTAEQLQPVKCDTNMWCSMRGGGGGQTVCTSGPVLGPRHSPLQTLQSTFITSPMHQVLFYLAEGDLLHPAQIQILISICSALHYHPPPPQASALQPHPATHHPPNHLCEQ